MKKKKLNLSLKKEVISKLQSQSVTGGTDFSSFYDWWTECSSDQGCTGGPDETLTCWAYTCHVC